MLKIKHVAWDEDEVEIEDRSKILASFDFFRRPEKCMEAGKKTK